MSAPATRVVLAITGASGAVYGDAVLAALVAAGVRVELVVSPPGQRVARDELGHGWDAAALRERLGRGADAVTLHAPDDIGAPIASGSFPTAAMIVAPCSMGSAGRIAAGLSDGLVERAADVHLKERRRLVLVVRETPLSTIHLENMLTVTRAGAVVLPAAPSFYSNPTTIDALLDTVVGRVLDQLGLPNQLMPRWGAGGAA